MGCALGLQYILVAKFSRWRRRLVFCSSLGEDIVVMYASFFAAF